MRPSRAVTSGLMLIWVAAVCGHAGCGRLDTEALDADSGRGAGADADADVDTDADADADADTDADGDVDSSSEPEIWCPENENYWCVDRLACEGESGGSAVKTKRCEDWFDVCCFFPSSDADTDTDVDSDADTDADTDTDTDTDADTDSDTDTDADTDTDSDTDTDADSDSNLCPDEPGYSCQTEWECVDYHKGHKLEQYSCLGLGKVCCDLGGSDTDTDTGADTDSGADTDTRTDTDADTDTGTGTNV